MVQLESHFKVAASVDALLLDGAFETVALTNARTYAPWYGKYLSSVAVLAAHQEVTYAWTDFATDRQQFRIAVFSTAFVLLSDINLESNESPTVKVIPRSALSEMTFSATDRIDAHARRSHEWPGTISLRLTYGAFDEVIEILGDGVNRYAVDKPSALQVLAKALPADLAAPN